MLDAVAHEIVNVGGRGIVIRDHMAPAAYARAHEEIETRFLERQYLCLERFRRAVAPRQHHGIFGDVFQILRMLQDDIAPHHHALAVLVVQDVVDASDVLGVYPTDPYLLHERLGRPLAEAAGLVTADVEELRLDNRGLLGIEIVEELVGLFVGGVDHGFGFLDVLVMIELEYIVEMPEGLLVADDFHVEPVGIGDQRS